VAKALIFGISGQDGSYLAEFLVKKGYTIIGTSRDHKNNNFFNLHHLGIFRDIKIETVKIQDQMEVEKVLRKWQPDEVYNLAGQSSVSFSFKDQKETKKSIIDVTLNILNTIRVLNFPIRFFNAASSECFGSIDNPASETTPLNPSSPYAEAKSIAFQLTQTYRKEHNLFASSGILFNHESPLRPQKFVIKKIAVALAKILQGHKTTLHLGNLNIVRDWGWAPEYIVAMWQMLQLDKPDDFIIATGESHSLGDLVASTFNTLDLNWKEFVKIQPGLFRSRDNQTSYANPQKAKKILNWHANVTATKVLLRLINSSKKNINQIY